MFKNFSNKSKI